MTAAPAFDPFHNRLCRDIRNALSVGFISAVRRKDLSPVFDVTEKFKSKTLAPFMTDYIENRLTCYQAVIDGMTAHNIPATDTYRIACSIWNQQLFFEVHEWLEPVWHQAVGTEKRMLQALIRAAGTYLLLEAGRKAGAQKLAAKAAAGLRQVHTQVPDVFDVVLLMDRLALRNPAPPRFTC